MPQPNEEPAIARVREAAARQGVTLDIVVMDPDLEQFPVVWAAAGTGTAVFPIEPAALRTLAEATVARIAEGVPA